MFCFDILTCKLILCVFTYVLHYNSDFIITFVNEMSYLDAIQGKTQQNGMVAKSLPQKWVILPKSFVLGTKKSLPDLQKQLHTLTYINTKFKIKAIIISMPYCSIATDKQSQKQVFSLIAFTTAPIPKQINIRMQEPKG